MNLQHMLLKIRKKTIWKFTFSMYHVYCLYLFYNSHSKMAVGVNEVVKMNVSDYRIFDWMVQFDILDMKRL